MCSEQHAQKCTNLEWCLWCHPRPWAWVSDTMRSNPPAQLRVFAVVQEGGLLGAPDSVKDASDVSTASRSYFDSIQWLKQTKQTKEDALAYHWWYRASQDPQYLGFLLHDIQFHMCDFKRPKQNKTKQPLRSKQTLFLTSLSKSLASRTSFVRVASSLCSESLGRKFQHLIK